MKLREIIMRVLSGCGDPPASVLNESIVLQRLQETYALYARQLTGSDENWKVRVSERFNPDKRDGYAVPFPYVELVKMELQPVTTGDPDLWSDCKQINISEINKARLDRDLYCATYGQPPAFRFSFDPTSCSFRGWYEPAAEIPRKLTDEPDINREFDSMMVVEGTLACLPYVARTESKAILNFVERQERVLASRLIEWKREWRHFVNSSGEQGVDQITPFNAGREMDSWGDW
jgi:hypothetical protein